MKDTVALARLGRLEPLGEGGFGVVFDLPDYQLDGRPAVFKRYRAQPSAVEIDNLRSLMGHRTSLSTPDRDLLDELFTWPWQLVTDGLDVVGFVMPRLDGSWFHRLSLETATTWEPREAQWILADTAAAALAGVTVPKPGRDVVRLVLCAKVARGLALLHERGMVYGDINPRNVLYRLEPVPAIVFVDCDGVKAYESLTMVQGKMDQWKAPECVGASDQTRASDAYKLALFVLRCLADGPRAGLTRVPTRVRDALGDDGVELVRAGLSRDPGDRPSAKQWYGHLRGVINAMTRPPTIRRFESSRPVVMIGESVDVSWSVEGAVELRVETPDGHVRTVDALAGESTEEIAITRSGPLVLTASNAFGTSHERTEPVVVFTPPTLELVRVPEPEIPVSDLVSQRLMSREVRRALVAAPSAVEVQLPPLPPVLGADRLHESVTGTMTTDVLPLLRQLDGIFDAVCSSASTMTGDPGFDLPPATDEVPR